MYCTTQYKKNATKTTNNNKDFYDVLVDKLN